MIDDLEEHDLNEDLLPTRELQKRQRKAAYEKAKADAKASRVAEKNMLAEKRALARAEKDKALWASIKKPTADDT